MDAKNLKNLQAQINKLIDHPMKGDAKTVLKAKNLSTRVINQLNQHWSKYPKFAVSTVAYMDEMGVDIESIKRGDAWQEFQEKYHKHFGRSDTRYAETILTKEIGTL